MPASRIGERPVSRVNLVDSFTEPSGRLTDRRRVARPRPGHLGHRADGEQVALAAAGGRGHDADAEPADHRRGQPGQDVAGAEVEDPAGAGLVQLADLVDPVDLAHQDGLGHLAGQVDVDADLLGPAVDDVDAVGQPRGVEADLDLDRFEHRAEHRAAAQLVLALGLFLLGDLLQYSSKRRQLLGRAGDDDRAPAVADRQHRRQHGAHVLGELVEQLGDAVGVGVGDRHHRRAVAEARRCRAGGPPACRRRRSAAPAPAAPRPWRPLAFSASTASTPCECPAIGDRRGGGQIHALAASARAWRRSGSAGCRAPRSPRTSAAWRWAPAPRRPARAPTAAARSRSAARRPVRAPPARAAARPLRPASLSSDSMPAETTSSSRFSSQALPWPPKATAYGSPAFRRSTRA